MVFSANEAPPTSDSSDAFFDRWLIVPFQQRHRGTDHQDHDLLAKLTTPAELSGLLNYALAGLDRLHRQHGFSHVTSSEQAAERFRIDSDSAAGFCEECCNLNRDGRIAKPMLFAAYKGWCDQNNRRPLAATRFNRRLAELHHLDEVVGAKARTTGWESSCKGVRRDPPSVHQPPNSSTEGCRWGGKAG